MATLKLVSVRTVIFVLLQYSTASQSSLFSHSNFNQRRRLTPVAWVVMMMVMIMTIIPTMMLTILLKMMIMTAMMLAMMMMMLTIMLTMMLTTMTMIIMIMMTLLTTMMIMTMVRKMMMMTFLRNLFSDEETPKLKKMVSMRTVIFVLLEYSTASQLSLFSHSNINEPEARGTSLPCMLPCKYRQIYAICSLSITLHSFPTPTLINAIK